MSTAPIQDSFDLIRILRAFLECDAQVQQDIAEMIAICQSDEADEQDKHMASLTIAEALFPDHAEGVLGVDLAKCDAYDVETTPEAQSIRDEMDWQETTFAERLQQAMMLRGLTQLELAQRAGVGQPAISNMLRRNCRPQRRTVQKLAAALEVEPHDLWPFDD